MFHLNHVYLLTYVGASCSPAFDHTELSRGVYLSSDTDWRHLVSYIHFSVQPNHGYVVGDGGRIVVGVHRYGGDSELLEVS